MTAAASGFKRSADTYSLLGCLHPGERIVVTGASGWMGRSLLHELEAALGDAIASQVLALGSADRVVRLGSGRPIQIRRWDHDLIAAWQPTACVHLAYLTRDHVGDADLPDYIRRNLQLTAMAARLQQLTCLRAFVAASSGAAVTLDWAEATSPQEIYGYLKRMDEAFFATEGTRIGIPTVIARTWSVSGPYCTKPSLFAFSDMIAQALSGDHVTVRARNEVHRRYVDAGQYLALCLRAALDGQSTVVNSTGPSREIRALAHLIAQELGAVVRADAPLPGVAPNVYQAEGRDTEALADEFSVALLPLEGQVAWTAQGLANHWG